MSKQFNFICSLLFIFLAITVFSLLSYIFVHFKYELSTDCAIKIFLSECVIENLSYLPPSWTYANGDIMLGTLHLPALLIYPFIDDLFTVHALNSLFYIVIYVLLVFHLIKRLKLSFKLKIFTLILLFSGFSFYYKFYLFGEIAYLPVVILFIYQLILVFDIVISSKRQLSKGYIFIAIITLLFFFIHNPSRYIVFNIIPFIIACILFNANPKRLFNLVLIFIIPFTLSVIGYYLVLKPNVSMLYPIHPSLTNYSQSISNLSSLAINILSFLGVDLHSQQDLMSLTGIRSFGSFCIVLFMIYALLSKPRGLDKRFMSILTILLFLITTFFQVFVDPINQDVFSIRYYYPFFVSLYITTILFLNHWQISQLYKNIIIITFSSFLALNNYSTYKSNDKHLIHDYDSLSRVSQDLKNKGIKNGYASFWIGGKLEIIADKYLDVILLTDNFSSLINFHPVFQDKNNFYLREDSSFLLMTYNEEISMKEYLKTRSSIYTKPFEIVKYDSYVLYLFDYAFSKIILNEPKYDSEFDINFNMEALPINIDKLRGFSGYEPTHRWTDEKSASISYHNSLPLNFKLEIEYFTIPQNLNESFSITIGDITQNRITHNLFDNCESFYFYNRKGAKKIIIEIEDPDAPNHLDKRTLGIGVISIRVLEL